MNAKDKLLKHYSATIAKWKEQRTPYVWTLCLSSKFHSEGLRLLEDAITESGDIGFLYEKEYAPIALLLLAEWYKRDYTGHNADNPEWVKVTEWKNIWQASGIRRWERWVYRFEESGNYSWQYSAYVLGGIACRFVHTQDSGNRLLKELCRLFHGQIDETEIDVSSNARALSMSIDKGGSIYQFLLELMDDASPLSHSYAHDPQEEVRNLRKKIMDSNKEVTKRKLHSEWRFTTSRYNTEHIHRSLRISLAPERVDGEKRWFLSRERAQDWGIELRDTLTDINVELTLYKDGEPTGSPQTVMNFQPTGSLKAGFNMMNEHPWHIQSNLPADLDGWKLSATTNDGQHIEIDPTINPVGDWRHIYQTGSNANVWSSHMRRMATAVIYNDKCRITDPDGHPIAGKMLLADNSPARHLNWADIPVYVKLTHPAPGGGIKEEKLVSPLACCRLKTDGLYTNLIEYLPGGDITVMTKDGQTGTIEEERMQLVFGLDQIYLIWLENGITPRRAPAETITARQNGKECPIDGLKKGLTELTAYANGMKATARVWYIPSNGKEAPGKRNLKKERVEWGSKHYPATPTDQGNEFTPTLIIKDTDRSGNEAIIKVYQPIKRTEIWIKDRQAHVATKDETIYLSLMSLPHIAVRRIDENGCHSWSGAEHLNQYKGLRIPSPETRKTEIPNIVVLNFKTSTPTPEKMLEIGDYQLEAGDPQNNWGAPSYSKRPGQLEDDPFNDEDDLFGNDEDTEGTSQLKPEDALEAAIEHDLYTFYFDELYNQRSRIPQWMDSVKKRNGYDFMKEHSDAVRRILWENDLTTKDLNFRI